jgi:hypothetical protein
VVFNFSPAVVKTLNEVEGKGQYLVEISIIGSQLWKTYTMM